MYSMSGEDEVVAGFFGDYRGRFLELGCCDGKSISNCYLLAQKGWAGVGVEASHRFVDEWFKNYAGMLDRVALVNEAIGTKQPGWGVYYDCYKDVTASSVDERLVGLGMSRAKHNIIHKYLVTPAELLARFPGPYDFVSIDLDGVTLPVMREIDFDAIKCRAVCVEYLHPPNAPSGVKENREIQTYFEERGWRHLLTNEENVIMVRGEAAK